MDLLEASRARWFQTADRQARSLAGHRRVLDAVRRHDPAAAYGAMLAHVRDVREVIPGEAPS